MNQASALEVGPVETVLAGWRHRAVTVFAIASAVVFLPAVLLMIAGSAPPDGWPSHVIVVAAYLCSVICALLHRSNYRKRAGILVAAIYLVIIVHLITIPQGPFGLALSALLPILAIVVLGVRAAWIATGASALLVFAGPLLQQFPTLVEALTLEPAAAPTPTNVVLHQGAALSALLVGQMILLDRFHHFLMRSLTGLQSESAERAIACRRLEREMLERQRLEYELSRVSDEERRRLGAEIHDGVCQQIAAALLRCQALGRRLERGVSLAGADFETISTLLADSIDEAHNVARGLCPLDGKPESLLHALRALVKRTRQVSSLQCELSCPADLRVRDQDTAQHLYRIVQEAISNAVRHANASRISVELSERDGLLNLIVEDDGVGLSGAQSSGGMGLRIMAHRARVLGGDLTFEPPHATGTRLVCRIPFQSQTAIGAERDGDNSWTATP